MKARERRLDPDSIAAGLVLTLLLHAVFHGLFFLVLIGLDGGGNILGTATPLISIGISQMTYLVPAAVVQAVVHFRMRAVCGIALGAMATFFLSIPVALFVLFANT